MPKKMLYQKNSLSAEYYDQYYSQVTWMELDDVEFYLKQAKRAKGPVLELASGTGRVSLPVAEAGCDVTGLDASTDMLKIAKSKITPELKGRVRCLRGNMRKFDLKRKFALVMIPFRSFLAMLTVEDQKSCLACVHKHLRKGGRLVLNMFEPLLEYLVRPDRAEKDSKLEVEGGTLSLRTRRLENDLLNQLFTEEWVYTLRDSRGKLLRKRTEHLSLRWVYHWEMRNLLELCGFKIVAFYGDFKSGKPVYGKEQVWIAQK